MCYYYVLNSVVYQAPDIYALVQSRLVSVVDPLRDALGKTLDSLRFVNLLVISFFTQIT